MRSILRLLPVLVFALFLVPAAVAQPVRVGTIRVVIHGETQESVVRHAILEFHEGEVLDRATLIEALTLVEERLQKTEYFSSVTVNAVDSFQHAGTVHVIVEVEDGFLWRFGGGPIFASVGQDNLGGAGIDLGLSLGTIQQFRFLDRNAGGAGWSWGGDLGNVTSKYYDNTGTMKSVQDLGGRLGVTQALGWGWEVSASEQAQAVFDQAWSPLGPEAWTEVGVVWDRRPEGFSPDHGYRLDASASVLAPMGFQRQEADARWWFGLGLPGLKGAARLHGGILEGTLPLEGRYAWVVSGLDGIRKPFSVSDRGSSLLVASAELRWELVRFPLMAFTTLSFEPALVADFAGPQTWAVGGALRVFFGAPVFVPLRFEYTLDPDGRGLFLFAVENPF